MAYGTKGGRPFEYASKAAHGHIINDPLVREFLESCSLPKRAEEVTLSDHELLDYEPVPDNPIRHVIAVDGGYDEVVVQSEFPSSTVCFFQFGALIFSVEDLDGLEEQPFIDPDDMSKLRSCCHCSLRRVMVAAESPASVPKNSSRAGTKSPLDKPCRYSKGRTSVTFAERRI